VEALASNFAWSSERYQLRELVGSGGMSQVYRAWDRQLDREVAIKVLHPHLAGSPESRRRFSREARAVAKLHHPHIVEIFDFSGDGDAAFIVTEFIRGTTLQKFSEQVGFGLPQIGALAAHSLCLALEHAHAAGVVHRDLKPENVMLGSGGILKLMDFGIARFLEQGEKMTMTGAMVGSPAYMAPEIIEGQDAGPKSDLFSLGTLLYWLLTQKLPFDAPNTPALLRKVVNVEYQDPRLLNGAISDSLAAVVRSLLARDPAARPESAEAVRVAIAAALAEDGITDPEASLRAFLADPPGFRHRFRSQLLTRLHGEAERARREHRPVVALKVADRILALEPEDTEARRLVAAISAQQRRRRRVLLGLYSCAGLAVLGGAVAGLRALELNRRPGTPAAAAPAPVDPIAQPPSAEPTSSNALEPTPFPAQPSNAPVHLLTQLTPAPTSAARRQFPGALDRIRLAPRPVAKSAEPISVSFQVHPFADVTIDGQTVISGRPAGVLSLTPGHHRVTFLAPGWEPKTEDLDVTPATGMLREHLTPKPALLEVIAQPSDASIMVDDVSRGKAADSVSKPIPIPMQEHMGANGVQTTDRKATVRVFKPGYFDWAETVDLRPAETRRVTVNLQAQGSQ
jgi:hypothetical protein